MPPGGTLLLNPIVNWPLLAPPPATVWVPGVTVNTVGAAAAAVGANNTAGNIPATMATAVPTAIRPNVRLLMGVPPGQGFSWPSRWLWKLRGCRECRHPDYRPDRILARRGLRLQYRQPENRACGSATHVHNQAVLGSLSHRQRH